MISPIPGARTSFFFQAEDGIRDVAVTGAQTCALPILSEGTSLPLARQLIGAQEYWRVKGLRADVVLLNEHPAEYRDEMQDLLSRLVQEPLWAAWVGKPGGIFLLRADGMPETDRRPGPPPIAVDGPFPASHRLVQEPLWAVWVGKPGGIFLLRADGMPETDRRLLSAVARVVLHGALGDLV